MLNGPLTSDTLELFRVVHQHASNFSVLWIFGFRCAEEGLEGKQSRFNCEYWRPGCTKSIKANSALLRVNLNGKICESAELTVWELTLGCQSLVVKNMIGGRKGYSGGILISTM